MYATDTFVLVVYVAVIEPLETGLTRSPTVRRNVAVPVEAPSVTLIVIVLVLVRRRGGVTRRPTRWRTSAYGAGP